MKITVDQPLHEGTTAVDPRDLALGHRQPLHLDLARARTPRRSSPTDDADPADQDDVARSTSTSSSTPSTRRRARRLQKVIQGQATVYTGNTRRPARPTSSSRPACSRRAAARRAEPRPAGAQRVPRRGLDGPRRARRAPRRPRRADLRTRTRRSARSRPRTRRSTASWPRCRRRCARRTRPSSTCARRSTTSIRCRRRSAVRRPTCRRSCASCAGPRRSVPVFSDLATSLSASRATTTTSPTRSAICPAAERGRANAVPADARGARRLASTSSTSPALHARPARLHHQARPGRPATTTQRPLRPRHARGANIFDYNAATEQLDPIPPEPAAATRSAPLGLRPVRALPGRRDPAERRLPDPEDHPFLDDGELDGDCDPDRRTPWPMRRVAGIILVVLAAAVALLVVGLGRRRRRRASTRSARSSTTPASWSPARRSASPAPRSARRRARRHRPTTSPRARTARPTPARPSSSCEIDDPGFQDFREDASCLIRPQSLLGEKFVECEPTQPRAPGTEAPPALEEIPDGEPGEGQHLLPLERNGKAVDLDLVNNIMREPYPDRFRLILNDLGAGLRRARRRARRDHRALQPGAARDERGPRDPRAAERGLLEASPSDADAVLERARPRARERRGFINTSNDRRPRPPPSAAPTSRQLPAASRASCASCARRWTELDAVLATPPRRSSPTSATAAPALTRATEALGPFAEAGDPALTSARRRRRDGRARPRRLRPGDPSDPRPREVRRRGARTWRSC